jgi:hypothetical protein
VKKLVAFLFIVLLIAGGLYLASGYILENVFKMGIDYLASTSKTFGIVIESPYFGSARLTNWNQLTLDGLTANIEMKKANESLSDVRSLFSINQTTVTMQSFPEKTFMLEADGIEITASGAVAKSEATTAEKEGGVKEGKVSVSVRLAGFEPSQLKAQLQTILQDVTQLGREGKTPLPIELQAVSVFKLDQEPVEARIWTEKEGDQYVLKMSPEDLVKIAKSRGDSLSEAEARLLSVHPIQAPEMMRITHDARRKASDAHGRNSVIPEDAYRHILWNFLLTKKFGEELTKQLTDAHEEGPGASANTAAQRQQDYNNNALGREYALAGLKESDILERVLNDPRVIRDDQLQS